MATLWQDIRFGLRMLVKNSGFSLAAIALVAVGVGATTAVFSILNAFLIRPLPYEEPDQLVLLYQSRKAQTTGVSRPNYLDWRQQAESFETMGCYLMRRRFWTVTETAPPEEYMTALVSGDFLQMLGVKPFLGRLLSEMDAHPSAESVVVVSYGFWRRRLGADPKIVGRERLGGRLIVGVLPRGFQYPAYEQEPPDIWVPLVPGQGDQWLRNRDNRVFAVLGRLRSNVGFQRARAEMDTIATRLAAQYPSENADASGIHIESLREHLNSGKQSTLAILMAAVAFVFLVACANLAGLLFARGVAREQELAVRAALGAGRLQLMRQLFVENVILAGLGGILGVIGAIVGLRLLTHTDMIASMMLPRGFFRLDLRVLGFALAVSILGVPLSGLAPSLRFRRIDLSGTLGSSGRTMLGSRGQNAIHIGLLAGEVALTIILLVAAGLMVRSFINVVTADLGFEPENVIVRGLYFHDDEAPRQPLLEALAAIPGVEEAALAYPPLRGWGYYFCVEGESDAIGDQAPTAEQKIVSADYFAAMGIRLLAGRLFDERDHIDASRVTIVDETVARHFWPDGRWVGRHIQYAKTPDANAPWLEVIGVVSHIKYQGVEAPSRMQMYRPISQNPHPNASIVLRTSRDPAAIVAAVNDAVRPFDPRPYSMRTLDQMLGGPSVMRRLTTFLLAAFGGIALFLSALGIYAVTWYSASRRTREFGIRAALGATTTDVFRLVLRRGLTPVLVGAGVGLIGAVATARVLSSQLFGLSPWDPATYGAVSLLLIGVAVLACGLPARRATQVDPMTSLRYE